MKITGHTCTPKTISLVLQDDQGKNSNRLIRSTDDRFALIKDYVGNPENHSLIIDLLDSTAKVEKLSEGKIKKGKKNALIIDTDEMPVGLADKIRACVASDLDPMPFVHFWQKLKQNPSKNSREQFYKFATNCKCNITPEGDVIVYKGVRDDLRSAHHSTHHCKDGTSIDLIHAPGTVLEIPREEANDDPNNACSYGLHCAPWNHVARYYSHLAKRVELKLSPADVVSVPKDGNGEKMRVRRYEILRVMGPGDVPLFDDLAKPIVKDSENRQKLQSKAKALKKANMEMAGDAIVMPPELIMAAGIEPREKVQGLIVDGYILVGKFDDTIAFEKSLRKKKSRVVPLDLVASVRNSIPIELPYLKQMMHETGETFTHYLGTVHKLGSATFIKITPNRDAGLSLTSQKHKISKESKIKEKSVKKKKAAVKKKAAKKDGKKVAKKAAKKSK